MIERIDTLEPLAERFDAFLVDQFGVLLDGVAAYPFAAAALDELARRGKQLIVLSNSGKRSSANEARLTEFGFDRRSYCLALSSGETAYADIARRIGGELRPGAFVWVHQTEDGASPLEGLALTICNEPGEADALLIAGCRPWAYSLDDYREWLRPAAEARVPCFCSNPDLTMMTAEGLKFSAGRVAQAYEEMGGAVERFGKPYPGIYSEALRRLGNVEREKIVCIGDSPAHDIVGGHSAGLATALTRTGIHAAESEAEVLARCDALGATPDFLLARMRF